MARATTPKQQSAVLVARATTPKQNRRLLVARATTPKQNRRLLVARATTPKHQSAAPGGSSHHPKAESTGFAQQPLTAQEVGRLPKNPRPVRLKRFNVKTVIKLSSRPTGRFCRI